MKRAEGKLHVQPRSASNHAMEPAASRRYMFSFLMTSFPYPVATRGAARRS
jgi:hypothetical protein